MKPLSLTLAALLLAATLAGCGPAPNPSETPAAVLSGDILLPNGLLPDGAYTPPAAAPRYYSQPTYTLLPRDDYGRIWPYIGGYAAQWWMRGGLYGLCDEDGTIICDPVFNQVTLLERGEKKLYALTKYGRGPNGEQSDTTTLAALDGSWTEVVSGYYARSEYGWEWHGEQFFYWGSFLDYQYITAQKDGKWGVLDFDGTELLPFAYLEPVCFYEGLAAVLSNDGTAVYFIDITGEQVLGPFDVPPQQYYRMDSGETAMPLTYRLFFVDGVCRFYDGESGLFGLIDREGNVITPPQYDYLTCFGGRMAKFVQGEQIGILNTKGEELYVSVTDDVWFDQTPNAGVISTDSANSRELLYPDGTRVPYAPEEGPEFDPFPLPDNLSDCTALENGTFLLNLRRDGGGTNWQLYDRNGAPLTPERTGYAMSLDGYIYTSAWDSSYEYATYEFYDLDGRPVLSGVYGNVHPFDKRFLVREKDYAGLLDEAGNWIIRVPLYDYKAD